MYRLFGRISGAGKMGKQERSESDSLTQEAKEQYEQLVREVRMRQHELGNQLSAAKNLTSGETKRYLEELNKDQRYNMLLLCGDPLLAGLLYQKCRKAETQGIRVESHISARLGEYAISQQDLIGIVGGLLDNAIDAELTRTTGERYIRVLVEQEGGRYRIAGSRLGIAARAQAGGLGLRMCVKSVYPAMRILPMAIRRRMGKTKYFSCCI